VLSSLSFLTPVKTLARESGLERGGDALTRLVAGELVVISRALCHFEAMPAPPGGRGPRAEQAARLAARTRAPFNDPRIELAWSGERIGVWSWDAAALPDDLGAEARLVPETLLHPPADGPVLRACLDGVEGQVWRDGALVASRWWRSEPTPGDWAGFLRAARTPWEGAPPAVETPALASRPTGRPLFSLDRLRALGLRDAAAAALVLAGAPLVFFTAQYASLTVTEQRLSSRVASLEGETAALEAARRRAAAAAAELRAYDAVIGRTHPGALLAEIAEQVRAQGAELDAFEVRDGRLQAQFNAGEESEFEPAAIVRALEAQPLFTGVSIEPGRRAGDWVVSAQVEEAQA